MSTHGSLDTVVDVVADLLQERIGLRSDRGLRGRLRRAVREEALRHGDEPRAYVDRLLADRDALQGLMNLVTVQETAFFRHPEQFEVLANDVLPRLPRPVRIWSAACANGQEAYSLAMVLEEQQVEGDVIATDLSTAALQRTAAARYTRRELSGLSAARLERHLTRQGEVWKVDDRVTRRVRTLHHNLLSPLPGEVMSCHVVFCRNVLIYLSYDQCQLFLDRVADALPPTLTLFVGSSETIWQVSDRFRAVQRSGCFIYRPRGPEPAEDRTPHTTPRPRTLPPASSSNRTRRPAKSSGSSRSERAGAEVASARRTIPPQAQAQDPTADIVARLERAGQEAVAVGDHAAAVIAFRKCAYLRPDDPLAQLHLGLALEAAGDGASANRAFAAARHALADAAPEHSPAGLEGYSAAELLHLLDSRR